MTIPHNSAYNKFLSEYMLSTYTVDAMHDGMRADIFLSLQCSFMSRSRLKQKIQQGESLLNNRSHSASKRIREGDVFTVYWKKEGMHMHQACVPEIVYEDEYCLAVNKKAGQPVHPTGRKQSGTLIQDIHYYYQDEIRQSLESGSSDFYPRLINRLDVFTSGIVLVSKRGIHYSAFQKLLCEGGFSKEYCALVEGVIPDNAITLDKPIGPDTESVISLKKAVCANGQSSRTDITVIKRFPKHTLLRAYLFTGRQHQIRVHLSDYGYPVVGDLLYKDEKLFLQYYKNDFSCEGLPERHCLHAERMTFVHPLTNEKIQLYAEIPEDMDKIINTIKNT